MKKRNITAFLLITILFLSACSSQPKDVRDSFYKDSLAVAKIIDNAMKEERYLTDKELKLHNEFISGYVNDEDIQESSNIESDIQTELMSLEQWHSLYVDVSKGKSKHKDPEKELVFIKNEYIKNKEKLIELLNVKEFTTE